MSKSGCETNASRALLSLVAGFLVWTLAAFADQMISLRVPLGDWNLVVRNVLPAHSVRFVLALVVGFIVWIVLRPVSKRRWQAAMVIGAVCYYLVPATFVAVGMFFFFQGFDWILFGRGPADVAATLAVGAVVGGAMWRVAYRRVVAPPAADVFA